METVSFISNASIQHFVNSTCTVASGLSLFPLRSAGSLPQTSVGRAWNCSVQIQSQICSLKDDIMSQPHSVWSVDISASLTSYIMLLACCSEAEHSPPSFVTFMITLSMGSYSALITAVSEALPIIHWVTNITHMQFISVLPGGAQRRVLPWFPLPHIKHNLSPGLPIN